jgi:glucose/arabinose dehydrogenase
MTPASPRIASSAHRPQGLRARVLATLGAAALALLAGAATAPAAAQAPGAVPKLEVVTVATGLRGPWDLAFAPDGAVLYTEKCHGLWVRLPGGAVRHLFGDAQALLQAPDMFCAGQSGVHGVVLDPGFARGQRQVYVYMASSRSTNPRTNRVVRLTVNADWTAVTDRTDIVTDISFKDVPRMGGPGAHSGGRMRFGPDGFLWVATGDNHEGALPQDPKRLGGKVLRIDRDGRPAPGNGVGAGFDPRIYTYGHRNVQGIAFRPAGQPGAGQAFVAEHGPNHTDEVTALVPGGNAGWDPQERPGLNCPGGYCGYGGNERTMPMTDTERFPNAMPPAWTNTGRSAGMGAAEFLTGPQWGAWNGRLAVALMRAQRLVVLTLDAQGRATEAVDADIESKRLRAILQGPDGALWATTDDGRMLRIVPR